MDFDFSLETITPDNTTLLTIGGTGALELPSGTTAQRPGTAVAGAVRWNTTVPQLEYYSGASWISFSNTVLSFSAGTTGLTPNTATTGAITLAGILNLASGGTNANLTAVNGGVVYSTASAMAISAAGTSGQLLTSNGAAAPTWSTVAAGSYSVLVGPSGTIPWSLVSGSGSTGLYQAVITHNLGTQNVIVQMADISNNDVVSPDLIIINSATQVTVQVIDNNRTLRVVIIANGSAIAAGGSTPSSVIIDASGVPITGGPFTTLNFTGYSVTPTGVAGVATINLTGTGVSSITGTANQITASASTGAVTLSTPAAFIAPGSVQVTTSLQKSTTNSISAAGTTQATATLITTDVAVVTTVAAGSGVRLSPSLGGDNVTIFNKGLNALLVYPASGVAFDNLAVNIPISVPVGQVYSVTGITSSLMYSTAQGGNVISTLTYVATSMDSPNNSDWVVNTLAATVPDPVNFAINVRSYGNSANSGAGFTIPIPLNATNILFTYQGRSQTAAAGTLQMGFYSRAIVNITTPAAPSAWSSLNLLTSQAIASNINYYTYTYTATLASLGLTAGNTYQMEFIRNTAVGGNLAQPWLLLLLSMSFT